MIEFSALFYYLSGVYFWSSAMLLLGSVFLYSFLFIFLRAKIISKVIINSAWRLSLKNMSRSEFEVRMASNRDFFESLQKNKGVSMGRIKPKYKHKNSEKGKVLIPDFIKWLKANSNGGEVHHFYGSNGNKFDCFVAVVSPDLHRDIHFGDLGVRGYIDMLGEDYLILNSMTLLRFWAVATSSSQYEQLANAILSDIDRAKEVALEFEL